MCAMSIMFDVLYLNLLTMGFSFFDYIKYIFTKLECLLILPGVILIVLSLRKKRIKSF